MAFQPLKQTKKMNPNHNHLFPSAQFKMKSLILMLSGLFASSAFALEPFVIKDIRVEGIQRTEPGTIFGYLPVKVGETMNDDMAAQAIKAL